jgi:hypothetical protein
VNHTIKRLTKSNPQIEIMLPNINDNNNNHVDGRILSHVKVDLERIGAGKQQQLLLIVIVVLTCVASLLIFLVWQSLRPYRERRRQVVATIPTSKTNYTARYQSRDHNNGAAQPRTCQLTLIYQPEQPDNAGWRVTGISLGEKCQFVCGRISTFGTVELALGDGGMYITGVFDPDSGAIAGRWRTKRRSTKSFAITLVPHQSQDRSSSLPVHATIV